MISFRVVLNPNNNSNNKRKKKLYTLNFLEVDTQGFPSFRSSMDNFIIIRFILLILRFGPSAEILDVKLQSFEDFSAGESYSQVRWKLWHLKLIKNEMKIWSKNSVLVYWALYIKIFWEEEAAESDCSKNQLFSGTSKA